MDRFICELTPSSPRQSVYTRRIILALVVALFILVAIVLSLLLIWSDCGCSATEIAYRTNTTEEVVVEPTPKVVRLLQRKYFHVIVAYHDVNQQRAEDVELYLYETLPNVINKRIYSELHLSKVGSKRVHIDESNSWVTLNVDLQSGNMMNSTMVVISEQFPPTAEQMMELVDRYQIHENCIQVTDRRCVQVCVISLTTNKMSNISSPKIEYQAINITLSNIPDYAQNNAIYLQRDPTTFTLTREQKGCKY